MPTINRIRVVNVVYDKGTKTYANDLFELNNQNTLFNLSNGGGKTVLLQLILQCILPNCDLGNERKFEHFFDGSRRTSYILVEWRLDNVKDDYVLTGICATKGSGDDGDIKYYTFVHHYNRENPYDIKNIPVVGQDRLILDYNEFRKLLDQVKDYKIKVFRKDERARYQDYLSSFGIYAEEWETIRTINLTEGGIGKFFEKSKTSRKFIENIVVPYVEEIIFKDKKDSEDLSRIFDKYSENLIQIPYFKSSIDLYNDFLDMGRNILQEVKGYSDLLLMQDRILSDIVKYRDFTRSGYNYYNNLYKAVNEKIEEIQDKLKLLSCRKDSYYLFVDEQKLYQLKEEIDKIKSDITLLEEKLKDKEEEKKYYYGAILLYEKKDYARKLSEAEVKYESITKSNEEILYDLNRCLFSLLKLYMALVNDIEGKILSNKEVIDNNKNKIKEFDGLKIQTTKELDDKKVKLGEVRQLIKSFKQKTEMMVDKYGYREIVLNLLVTIDNLSNDLKELKKRFDENNKKLVDIENQINDSEIEKERILQRINEETRLLQDKIRDIDLYNADYEEVLKNLVKYEISANNIFDGTAVRDLSIKQKEYEQKLWDSQNEYLKYKQKAMLLSEDFYIPDADILKVYNLLKDNKYDAITGSEYLSLLHDDVLKKRYISGCPLLPFGIVMDRDGIKRMEDDDIFNGIELSSIVPIIARDSIRENSIKEYGRELAISDGVYCINNKGLRYYVSKAEYDDLKENINNKTALLENEIKLMNQSTDDIKNSLNVVNKFLQKYSKDYYDKLIYDKEMIENKIKDLKDNLSQIKTRVIDLKGIIDVIRRENNEIEKNIGIYERNIDELNEYMKENKSIEDAYKQENECVRFIEENQEKLNQIEENLQNIREENNKIMYVIEGLNRDRDNTLKKINNINIPNNFNIEYPSEKTIEELEGIKNGIEEKLRGITGDTEELQKNMDMCKTEIAKRERQLKKLNLNEAKLEGIKPVSDETISSIDDLISDLNNKIDEKKRQYNKLDKEIGKIEQRIELRREDIVKKYGIEPFHDFKSDDDSVVEKISCMMEDCKRRESENKAKLEKVSEGIDLYRKQCDKANEFLAVNMIDIPSIKSDIEEHIEEEYDKVDAESLSNKFIELNKHYNDIKDNISNKRKAVDDAYKQMNNKFVNCTEDAISKFISSINISDGRDERLYSYDSVNEVFSTIFDSVERLKKVYEHDLIEADKQKEQLVVSCKQHVDRVLNEINSIDTKSNIKFNGTNKNMIQIRLESSGDELNFERIRRYIETCIEDIKKEHEKSGGDRNVLYPMIKNMMSTVKLLSVVTDLEKSVVRVFKPQNNPNLSRYENWEAVLSFSGGEKYTCFFAMYISMLSYIRSKKSYGESSLVLLADNPFGTTSAEYLLDVIFALAQKCRTQLICFTGLKETGIYSKFNTIYSLVLRNTIGGKQRIRSELIKSEMESGYVSFEQQVSLFSNL